MARGFKVFTEFRVRNNQVSKTLKSFRKDLKGLKKSSIGVGNVFKGVFGANLATRGTMMMTQGVRNITDEFIDLDQNITGAAARWGKGFERGSDGFKELSANARKVASDTEFMAAETSKGLDFFARAGLSAKTSMGLLPGVADLATAANFDFATSADIATDALGAFGKAEGTTAEKIFNFNKIANQAAKTANMANMDLGMWFETVKKVGPASVDAGQDMSTMNAVFATLANSGLKAETAGVQVRQMFAHMADPVAKAKAAFEELKVEIADGEDNWRQLPDIITDVKKAMDGMGSHKRSKLMKRMFGVRQVSAAKILFDAGGKSINEMGKKIKDSSGFMNDLAEIMRGSVRKRMDKMKSQLVELGLKFMDTFGPKIPGWIDSISGALQTANANFKKFTDMIAAAKAWFEEWRPWIEAVTAGLSAYLAITLSIVVATKAFGAALAIVGMIMKASPWTWVLIGVVAAVTVIYRYRDEIMYLALLIKEEFQEAWIGIKDFTSKMWDGIKNLGKAVLDFLITPFKWLLELIAKIPGVIGQAAQSGLHSIETTLKIDNDSAFSREAGGKKVGKENLALPMFLSRSSIADRKITSRSESYSRSESTQTVDFKNVPDFVNISQPGQRGGNPLGATP